MSLARKFKTDRKCETDGICLDYGDGQRIWVARAGGANKAFLREAQRVFRKYRKQIELATMPEELQQRIVAETYARTIVLRWEGITAEDVGGEGSEPVECTFENVVKLFENLPDLFADVQRQATNAQLFLEDLRETDAGN